MNWIQIYDLETNSCLLEKAEKAIGCHCRGNCINTRHCLGYYDAWLAVQRYEARKNPLGGTTLLMDMSDL